MKIKLIQLIKILILALTIGFGVNLISAWTPPPYAGTISYNNTRGPINSSVEPQAKGGMVLTSTDPTFIPPLLDINGGLNGGLNGILSAQSLAITGVATSNTVIHNDLTIAGLQGSEERSVCVDGDGKLTTVNCPN